MKWNPKPKRWQLQEAKARFSEVVDTAGREGPQTVTRHGKICAYVVSPEHFQRLQPPAKLMKLSELFRPLSGVKTERTKDFPRPSPDFGK